MNRLEVKSVNVCTGSATFCAHLYVYSLHTCRLYVVGGIWGNWGIGIFDNSISAFMLLRQLLAPYTYTIASKKSVMNMTSSLVASAPSSPSTTRHCGGLLASLIAKQNKLMLAKQIKAIQIKSGKTLILLDIIRKSHHF